jgi:hypothetical protein
MSKRRFILAALAGLFVAGAERQVSAGSAVFEYGTTVTPNPINPTGGNGPGSQISVFGVGDFANTTAPFYSASLNGSLGADITVGKINVSDFAIGAYTEYLWADQDHHRSCAERRRFRRRRRIHIHGHPKRPGRQRLPVDSGGHLRCVR